MEKRKIKKEYDTTIDCQYTIFVVEAEPPHETSLEKEYDLMFVLNTPTDEKDGIKGVFCVGVEDFVNIARAVCTLCKNVDTIVFEVASKGVNFLDEIELTADEAFSVYSPRIGRPCDKIDSAVKCINELLSDGKLHLSTDCEAKLEAEGFKKSTVKKAKRNAGVMSVKDGFLWYWHLPSDTKANDKKQEVEDEDCLLF